MTTSERPSLGEWVARLREGVGRGHHSLRPVVDIIESKNLVQIRNAIGHDYDSITEESYLADIERLETALQSIEKIADGFLCGSG